MIRDLNYNKVYTEVKKISAGLAAKILFQVEGPTSSGKTTFIEDMHVIIREKKLDALIIEDCATKVFRTDPILFLHINSFPIDSLEWQLAKIELQQKVLFEQLDCLKQFVEDDNSLVAFMDRGGASTAYHMLPLSTLDDKKKITKICCEISRMSTLTIMFSSIGFIANNTFRYQKNLKEIMLEEKGIRSLLRRWAINYLEIKSLDRLSRIEIGVRNIFPIITELLK